MTNQRWSYTRILYPFGYCVFASTLWIFNPQVTQDIQVHQIVSIIDNVMKKIQFLGILVLPKTNNKEWYFVSM